MSDGGEQLSLTKAFNVIEKLRKLGATRVVIGDIMADFTFETMPTAVAAAPDYEEEDRHDVRTVPFDPVNKWDRS